MVRYLNQTKQLTKHALHLLQAIVTGELTYPEAMLRLAQEKLGWQSQATGHDSLTQIALASLKDHFDPGSPTPIPAPKPLPKVRLTSEALAHIERQRHAAQKQAAAREARLRWALSYQGHRPRANARPHWHTRL